MRSNLKQWALFSIMAFGGVACVHAPEFRGKSQAAPQKYNTPASFNNANAVASPNESLIAAEMKVEGLDVTEKEAEEVEALPKPIIGTHDLLTVPPEGEALVQKWVNYFQGRGRPHMERYLSRLGRYESYMTDILVAEGLPRELIYVALIESGFSTHARSHASAVGYWQFIRSTGRGYGLVVNSMVDERKNPRRATEAAAQYFKALYNVFGSWPLALASYNAGENRVMRSIMRNYNRDFWHLALTKQLPNETSNYVPKFIAAARIGHNPEKYGFNHVVPMPGLAYETIELKQGVSMSLMAKNLGVSTSTLRDLNPAFNTDFVPIYRGNSTEFKVPEGLKDKALAAANISATKHRYVAQEDAESHRVRSGDSLYRIARRYGTTVAALQRHNNLSNRSIIRPGMNIKIPGKGMTSNTYSQASRSAATTSASKRYHKIRRGETLYGIAKKYGVGLSALAQANNMTVRTRVQAGASILIP